MTSSLALKRLVITKSGKTAYDQLFHNGLNIIYGANGSGKSSIMNFIFYVLGGELREWKEYALSCDFVLAEIDASGNTLCLRREVSQEQRRPLHIFFGTMAEASASSEDRWQRFGFARTENAKSFSQVLFAALNIPEVPGEQGSNITMHQILRLMYVDQTTPFQKVFRLEEFDPREIKEAVAELLLGIGDQTLYGKRLQLRELRRQEQEVRASLAQLLQVAGTLGEQIRSEAIAEERRQLGERRMVLYDQIEKLHSNDADSGNAAKEAETKRRKLYDALATLRFQVIEDEKKEEALSFEIADSERFISYLRGLLGNFDEAMATYLALGSVEFEYCPACLSPLHSHEGGKCHLCGNPIPEEQREAKALALRVDIEGQLQESISLQSKRREELVELASSLSRRKGNLTRQLRQLDELSAASVDGRTAIVSEKSREIGRIEGRLEELDRFEALRARIEELSDQRAKLADAVSRLDDDIKALETRRERRRSQVLTTIALNARRILEKDLSEHNDFDHLENFTFSLEDDWFAVNGQPNITTSASGMVVVKNSLFLAMLRTSILDSEMRYPKFLLLDNVEDKGMVGERVMHFQGIIADTLEEEDNRAQVIMTTSTINPALNNPKYVVGDTYTKAHRTLRIE